MNFKQTIKSIAVACSLAAASASHATPVYFDSNGDSQTFTFNANLGSSILAASITMTLDSLSASSATFKVDVTNNSSGQGLNELYAFSIYTVTPDLTSVSVASSAWTAALNTTFAGYQSVDLCVFSTATSACSTAAGGLAEGASDTYFLTVGTAGNFETSGIVFDSPYNIGFKNVGSLGNGAIQFESNPVPEPSSIALTGLVLVGLAGARRAIRKNA